VPLHGRGEFQYATVVAGERGIDLTVDEARDLFP